MKVLQINSVCGFGSTGRIAVDLQQCLKDSGDTGVVAYGRKTAKGCDSTVHIGSKWDVYRHIAEARLLDRSGFGSENATVRFLKQVGEYHPDILHLHNIHGYYLHVGKLFEYLKSAKKPVVWTLHDCWAFTGHCAYFEFAGCKRWIAGCHDCPQKSAYPSRWWRDNSVRNYSDKKELFTGVQNLTIVTPSEWLAEQVKQSFLGGYPVHVIPNGVDLTAFRPTESDFRKRYGIRPDEFVVLGVASFWEERKGLSCFIELAQSLHRECRFVTVGVTDRQRREFPEGTIGIARTESPKELAEIYSAADVFVNTTLDDNFPTTNLESLACGTPVVTFRTGGSTESVGEGTGIVVEKADGQALADAVRGIKSRTKAAYTEACVEEAKAKYDKKTACARYIELYRSLL